MTEKEVDFNERFDFQTTATEEEKENFLKEGKKIYPCKDCDAEFYIKGNLDNHICLKKENEEEIKKIILNSYNTIIEVLREYADLREEYYSLVATWIIGTYLHSTFNSYPYLFINAMRGSGKTRLLKLINSMAYKSTIIGSPTEAVLFRMPKGETICIDEFEGVQRKGNEGMREILNASYKKGMTIKRMKKVSTKEGTTYEVEEFEPYKPVCLANIWGMEEVLGDRCVTMILEKSSKQDIMRLIEDFDQNISILGVKKLLSDNLVQLCSFFSVVGYIETWNIWVKLKYSTLYTQTTLNTLSTQTTQEELIKKGFKKETLDQLQKNIPLFEKIDSTGIIGRNLELFFPMIIISNFIGEEASENILKIATTLNNEKKAEEMIESKDVALFDFVSQIDPMIQYRSIRNLTVMFRNFVGDIEEQDDKWLNEKWVGRALKRLNLIVDKRRVAKGIEVTLNISKAKEKMEVFK